MGQQAAAPAANAAGVRERWHKWAVAEGLFRTLHNLPQNVAGKIATSIAFSLLATFTIGLVQIAGGLIGLWIYNKLETRTGSAPARIRGPRRLVLGSIAFGVLGSVSMTIGTEAFRLGGEVGAVIFLSTTVSLITGALIDGLKFKSPLSIRQWLGVLVAIAAGYQVLGSPSLAELSSMPSWAWISIILGFLIGVNQGITQLIKEVNPFVKTFWIGVVYSAVGLTSVLLLQPATFKQVPLKFWFVAVAIGVFLVGVLTCNVMGFQKGAPFIALKKVVVYGTWLITAFVSGALFFNESVAGPEFVAMALYPVAFALVDNDTWAGLRKLVRIDG